MPPASPPAPAHLTKAVNLVDRNAMVHQQPHTRRIITGHLVVGACAYNHPGCQPPRRPQAGAPAPADRKPAPPGAIARIIAGDRRARQIAASGRLRFRQLGLRRSCPWSAARCSQARPGSGSGPAAEAGRGCTARSPRLFGRQSQPLAGDLLVRVHPTADQVSLPNWCCASTEPASPRRLENTRRPGKVALAHRAVGIGQLRRPTGKASQSRAISNIAAVSEGFFAAVITRCRIGFPPRCRPTPGTRRENATGADDNRVVGEGILALGERHCTRSALICLTWEANSIRRRPAAPAAATRSWFLAFPVEGSPAIGQCDLGARPV